MEANIGNQSHFEDLQGVEKVVQDDKNPNLIKVTIKGPENSPYEAGSFVIQFDFSKNKSEPKSKMVTKIYHPCINFVTGQPRCNMPSQAQEQVNFYLQLLQSPG